jgi:hypothetical protein
VNKGAINEHLTEYQYTRSEKTRLVHKYILRGLAVKEAQSTINRRDYPRVDKRLRLLA